MAEEPEGNGGGKAVAVRAPRQTIPVEATIPIFDTAAFEHQGRIAAVMARASLIPEALRPNPEAAVSNCFMIVNQAQRWGMDPFAVAQCCSVVHGALMYEGKLVAAVIKSKLGLDLHYHFVGDKGTMEYRVYVSDKEFTDKIIAELKPGASYRGWRIIDGSVGEWHTKEKGKTTLTPAWLNQPDMQLCYRGARVWCRRYEPALMLGVYTEDEMEDLRESRAAISAPAADRPRLTSGFGDETDQTFRAKPAAEAQGSSQAGEEAERSNGAADAGASAGASQEPAGDGKSSEPAKEEHVDADGVVHEGPKPDEDKGAAEAEKEEAKPEPEKSPATSSGSQESGESDFPGDRKPAPKEEPKKEPAKEPARSSAEPTGDAFAEARSKIEEAPHWLAIKQAMRTLQASEDWKAAEEEHATRMRGVAWSAFAALVEADKEKTPVSADPYLFRLWMNFGAKSAEEIDGLFPALMRSPDWQKLTDGQKNDFGAELKKVKEALADG